MNERWERGSFCVFKAKTCNDPLYPNMLDSTARKIVQVEETQVVLQKDPDSKTLETVPKSSVTLLSHLDEYAELVKWMRPNQVCQVQQRVRGAPKILARIVSVKVTYPRAITLSLPSKFTKPVVVVLEVDEPNVPYDIYYPYLMPFDPAYDKSWV